MPEYIDRDKVLRAVEESTAYFDHRDMPLVKGNILRVPPADVEPVIHAHWEPKFNDKGRSDGWICTAPGCGVRSCCKGNYCPNCGAKMDA